MSSLVNTLGMVAGSVWVCTSIWFQLIHPERVHPKYVVGTFLVGSALILTSSSAVLSPSLAESFAVAANILFIVLGLAAWLWIERTAETNDLVDDVDSGVRT